MANVKHIVGEVEPTPTLQEFEAFLAVYKEQNPEKYEKKEANDEYWKIRRTLVGYNPEEDPKVIAEKKAEAEAKAEAKDEAEVEAKVEAKAKAKAKAK